MQEHSVEILTILAVFIVLSSYEFGKLDIKNKSKIVLYRLLSA
jgi:hypothetical protein